MKRKICLLLCLALTLGLLSGCKLIVKDEAVDAATPAVEVNGEVITKGEVNERALRRQAAQQYIGMDVDPIETARSKVIDKLIREKAIEQKMAQFGVEPVTEAEFNEAANMGPTFSGDDFYEQYTDYVTGDMATLAAMKTKLQGKVAEANNVTVDEAKLEEDYKTKLEADQAKYTDQAAYVTAGNADTESYYVPGDIRMVKQILIRFTDEEVQQLQSLAADKKATKDKIKALKEAAEAPAEETPAETTEAPAEETETPAEATEAPAEAAEPEETLESLELKLKELESQYQIALAAACEGIQDETDHVMEELRNGGDWDAISADHNDDPGMMAGRRTAETGYAIYAEDENFDAAFKEAAMSLQNPGDIADPAAGVHGYYIVRLERDLTEGVVAFEEVHDALYKEAYDQQASELYDTLVEQWVSEATVVRHDEVFK